MKKVIFLLSVVALVGASSCNKAYTCTCTASAPVSGSPVQNYAIPSTTKSTATTTCSSWQTTQQATYNANGGTGKVTCSI